MRDDIMAIFSPSKLGIGEEGRGPQAPLYISYALPRSLIS
jgi:hypothetical protein